MTAALPPLQPLLDFAVEIAHEAGALTLAHFNAPVVTELKADQSPVTEADRRAEQHLRRRITTTHPDHGVLGEEFGETRGSSPARWILDPIDGTVSFICGVPLYAVLVGLEWAGEMVVGVIHLPPLKQTVYAARGLGCWCDGRRARVSQVSDLGQARLLVGGVRTLYQHGRGPAYERLRDACKLDRGWSDAYAYALIATGRAEIALDPIMSIWDCAAPMVCVTEAGGSFTDWFGRPTHTAPEALATNGRLLPAVLDAVRGP